MILLTIFRELVYSSLVGYFTFKILRIEIHTYHIDNQQDIGRFSYLFFVGMLIGNAIENLNSMNTSIRSLRRPCMYYIKLSGTIPGPKQLEFEQTYRFASIQIPKTCKGYNMTRDVLDDEIYHFSFYWDGTEAMHKFIKSSPYLIIVGAFRTLGELKENSIGEIVQSNKLY